MMPGGDDLVLEGRTTHDLRLLLPLFRARWLNAVFELDDDGDGVDVFVYETVDGLVAWRKDGATSENESMHPMVHVLLGGKSVTFVVDKRDSPTGQMVSEIMKQLAAARVALGPPKEVAWIPSPSIHTSPNDLAAVLKSFGFEAAVTWVRDPERETPQNWPESSRWGVCDAGTNMWFIVGVGGRVYRVPGEEP